MTKRLAIGVVLLVAGCSIFALPALAQDVGLPDITIINPLGEDDLFTFLQKILDLVIRIGTIVVVLMLVYIGYLFATSSVNPENMKNGRSYLLWTLVGALILLGAKVIAEGIKATVDALK